ncbi:DNA helicase RecQ [bacterium]|nr:DNA helicase RecQ [bacterium]
MPLSPLDVLRSVFGHQDFRGLQQQVIAHLMAGQDALLLMPTGQGKSLCYQIPALLRPGLGVVVSPLIALMQDQVTRLQGLGVRAAVLNSSLTMAEAWEVKRRMMARELDLLYVAPERLTQEGFLRALDQLELALFAIDEAHCVSQWGHNFRPEYLQLHLLRERYPGVPRLALTATADLHTRAEIMKRLGLPPDALFAGGFDRPNIRYVVTPKTNWKRQILSFLRSQPPGASGIIYRLTRKSVDATADYLRDAGINAIPYHAGMEDEERRRHQQRFLDEPGAVVVATIAFGMGIDKPDVRFVAHLDMPKTLEDYHQQTGRAGRDGLPATAWLAYGPGDAVMLRRLIEGDGAAPEFQQIELGKLRDMTRFCEATECRRRLLLRYFGEDQREPCGNCDVCLRRTEDWPATQIAVKALLCILEAGQRFGVSHLTDVLTGSRQKRVVACGHARLRTFGAGAELSRTQWRSVFTQLTAQDLVEMAGDGYPTLRLTATGEQVLCGEREVVLQREVEVPDPTPARRERTRTRAPRPADPDRPPADPTARPDAALFEALRAERKRLADDQGVPAFVIFPDTALRDMALRCPRTPEAFLQVKGVGEAKCERYAATFLEVIRIYVEEEQA